MFGDKVSTMGMETVTEKEYHEKSRGICPEAPGMTKEMNKNPDKGMKNKMKRQTEKGMQGKRTGF